MKLVHRYESTRYLGGQSEHLFKTRMIAWGDVNGELHTYSRFVEAEDCQPGSVTDEFKQDAEMAFERAWQRVTDGR